MSKNIGIQKEKNEGNQQESENSQGSCNSSFNGEILEKPNDAMKNSTPGSKLKVSRIT
jgi:hypothetical protein